MRLLGEASRRGNPGARFARFDFSWCLLLFALTSAPSLLATFAPPDGHDGFGTIMFVNDFAAYEGAMAEGARGLGWLVHDHFSPEAHMPVFMFPLYVAIGKLAAALALPAIAVYRAFELLGRLIVLLTCIRVARSWFPTGGKLAVVLGTVGGGLGIWAALPQAALGIAEPYGLSSSYELNIYTLLFAPPHITIGMALTLAIVIMLVQAEDRWSLGRAVQLGLSTIALCLLHPFNVTTLGIVSLALALAPGVSPSPNQRRLGPWRRREEHLPPPRRGRAGEGVADPTRQWGALTQPLPLRQERGSWWRLRSTLAMLVFGSIAAPFVLYNAAIFTLDPFWGTAYGAQNALPSPALHELVVDLGILGLVGIPWLFVLARRPGPSRRLALAIGVILVLMYTPVPFQRRFAFGVAPLLGMVTGVALSTWRAPWPWLAPRFGFLRAATLVAALSSTVIFYSVFVISTRINAPIPMYRASTDLRGARDWLSEHSRDEDIVLASWDVANYLAGAIPGRTAGGHPVATLRGSERWLEAKELFAGRAQQHAAIAREHPTFLVSAGTREPFLLEGLTIEFTSGGVNVARVNPAARTGLPWPTGVAPSHGSDPLP